MTVFLNSAVFFTENWLIVENCKIEQAKRSTRTNKTMAKQRERDKQKRDSFSLGSAEWLRDWRLVSSVFDAVITKATALSGGFNIVGLFFGDGIFAVTWNDENVGRSERRLLLVQRQASKREGRVLR